MIPVQVVPLKTVAMPLLLESCPPVLSVGRRCIEEGFEFRWKPYSQHPTFRHPDGTVIVMEVEGFVPYIVESLPPRGILRRSHGGSSLPAAPVEESDGDLVGPEETDDPAEPPWVAVGDPRPPAVAEVVENHDARQRPSASTT